MSGARLHTTIPALPVRDIAAAAAYYRERFGFDVPHQEDGFALLTRDSTELHLWAAADDEWRMRPDLRERPVCSGAESFLDFGTREFATLDRDGNLLTFFATEVVEPGKRA
jgi:catechol 2,3-dioxygenase-like lactoylglutathione lyase family enzyme